jgi:hypothetical protein
MAAVETIAAAPPRTGYAVLRRVAAIRHSRTARGSHCECDCDPPQLDYTRQLAARVNCEETAIFLGNKNS